MTINRITRDDVNAFDGRMLSYQRIATKSAIYPGQGSALGLVYVALKGAGEAGEFAEHVGKAMRDDGMISHRKHYNSDEDGPQEDVYATQGNANYYLTPERKMALVKEIGDQLWYLSAKCNELGVTLEEAAQINLVKLCDRSERDALQGSGDER